MDLNRIFRNHKAELIDIKKEYSIIILIVEINKEKHIIFEKRGKNISQPGEVSLPGGKVENGENPLKTVKRETFEELGIKEDKVNIITKMGYLHEFENELLRVYIGDIEKKDFDLFVKNDEVEYIFTYPISYFMENKPQIYKYQVGKKFEDKFPFDLIPNGENYNFKDVVKDIYFYEDTNPVIWGMTAKIISKFIDICKGD